MNRRDAIKQSFLVIGGTAISTSVLSGLLVGCQADAKLAWTPTFLTEEEAKTLTSALDVLLPTTDTPGALDAGVPQFLDQLANDFLPEDDQQKFREGIKAMNTDSEAKYSKAFAQLSEAQQTELLTAYDQAAFGEGSKEGLSAIDFYPEFKQSACWAFCTSEPGATKHLQFVFDPRGYSNCVPIAEVGGKAFLNP
ncbi:MAG: gluconate 2-dehydrogenase subunit 3 family protein [Bacteroidota bacterium]